MDSGLYKKSVECPLCKKNIIITAVKSKTCKIDWIDSDFCLYYEGINPLLYEAWVCVECGYAARKGNFGNITPNKEELLKEKLKGWEKRETDNERNLKQAIAAFKIVLYNAIILKEKNIEIASICMRIAWLYRLEKNKKEIDFLEKALQKYIEVYDKEHFPIGKLDEHTCEYLIGELQRRTGNFEEALKWFGKIIGNAEAMKIKKIAYYTREQYYLTRKQISERKEEKIQ